MKKTSLFLSMAVSLLGITIEGNAMEWFQTWDRPEYKEWAAEIPEGYLLHIVRKEKNGWLAVQAKLMMGDAGLPGFEVVEQQTVSDEQTAKEWIHSREIAHITN